MGHGDRLSGLDTSFLNLETGPGHMHGASTTVFEGPAPTYEEFRDHIASRLHLVPRLRQKLRFAPFGQGRPVWIDDPQFNLDYHVRHTALPSPGSEDQLRALAARIHSQQLDRAKPLWETWLVQGLEGDRFALISKTHHAVVDGVAGVDLATVLFDAQPVPPELPHEGEPWRPQPEPSGLDLAARGIRGMVRTPFELAGRAAAAATRPNEALGATRVALEGLGEVAWQTLNPAPETPLNVEIGPHRRVAWLREELDDFKVVKNAFGGTVNDVVLTVVSGGLQKWLRSRGTRTEGLELRALVPVSIRTDDQHHQLGNRLAVMRGPLPVYVEYPVARLRVVRAAMDGLKESKQAVGAEVLAGVQNFTPPTLMAQASRLNFSTRLFNLLVTNVPGPQFPLYMLGRELRDLFPVAFLPENQSLAVAIMSYNGSMDFGLLGDYDAMHDLDDFGAMVDDSLQELLDAAEKRRASNGRAKAAAKKPAARKSGATAKKKPATRAKAKPTPRASA